MASDKAQQKFAKACEDLFNSFNDGNPCTVHDLRDGLKEKFPNYDMDDLAVLFVEMDDNDDNTVTCEEFVSELTKMPKKAVEGGALKQLFDEADDNGSGLLDKEEMKRIFLENDIKCSPEKVDHIFDACDKDGNGQISYKEFLTEWQRTDTEDDE